MGERNICIESHLDLIFGTSESLFIISSKLQQKANGYLNRHRCKPAVHADDGSGDE